MQLVPRIKNAFKPTWTKSIVCAVLSCAFVLIEYRSPSPTPAAVTDNRPVKAFPAKLLPAIPFTRSTPKPLIDDAKAASEKNSAENKKISPSPSIVASAKSAPAVESSPTAPSIESKAPVASTDKQIAAPKVATSTIETKVAAAAPKKTRSTKKRSTTSTEAKPYKSNDDTQADSDMTVEEALASLAEPNFTLKEIRQTAVNQKEAQIPASLKKIIEDSLDEPSLTDDYQTQWAMSAVQDDETDLDDRFPPVPRFSMVLGTYQQDQFADLKASLAKLKTETPAKLSEPPAFPSKDATPEKSEPLSIAQVDQDSEETTPTLSVPGVAPKATSPAVASSNEPSLARESAEREPSLGAKESQTVAQGEDDTRDMREAGIDPALIAKPEVPSVGSSDEESSFPTLSSQESEKTLARQTPTSPGSVVIIQAPKTATNQSPTTQNVQPVPLPELVDPLPKPRLPNLPDARAARRSSKRVNEAPEYLDEAGIIYGSFSVDNNLASWLESYHGHVELNLEPIAKPDRMSADTQFIDYRYPSAKGDAFTIDTKSLSGKYTLYARVYMKGLVQPVASIPYLDQLYASYNPKVRFALSWSEFNHNYKYVQNVPSQTKTVSLSLFEGLAGDPKKPPRIANATVKVVGFPEWGTFTSDKDGNVRIPNVPSHSEIAIDVCADQYYCTEKIQPVFNSDAYDPSYLISLDKADAFKYWTHEPPDPNKGIIVGKIFDSKTRKPKAGEHMTLTYRKGEALYMDALPNPLLPETTTTGLFGFFNVIPSVRALARATPGSLPVLVFVKKYFAQYVEIGRAGSKPLTGRLFDIVNNLRPPAEIRVVGEKEAVAQTDGNGDFALNVDLPTGVLPLEVKSSGYMTSWHMLPWNPSERSTRRNLFELPQELVKDSALGIAKIRNLDPKMGSILGGAEAFLFEGRKGCNKVDLVDSNGQSVKSEHGPFAWGRPQEDPKSLCLDSEAPRFAYYNLAPGMYVLKWLDPTQHVFRTHIVYVGMDRVSMVIS